MKSKHELWEMPRPLSFRNGDWFRPLVTAAFDEADREREKTNISKYVSVLCYAQRVGEDIGRPRSVPSTEIESSEIVRLEAESTAH